MALSQAYASIDAFIADPAIDAVYIASPNSAHVAQSLMPSAREKRFSSKSRSRASEPEAEVIAARRASMEVRHGGNVDTVSARHSARQGADRERRDRQIKSVRGELSYFNAYDPQSRMFNKALGGGASLDLGVYLLSLMHIPVRRAADFRGWNAAASGVDARRATILRYAGISAPSSRDKTGAGRTQCV